MGEKFVSHDTVLVRESQGTAETLRLNLEDSFTSVCLVQTL